MPEGFTSAFAHHHDFYSKDSKFVDEYIDKNGEVYKINDTIYVASEVLGEPYSIGKILQISQDKFNYTNCLVSWFYRPKDVHLKRKADQRLVIATMHSDWISTSTIRGKCIVEHKDDVENLEAFKQLPDTFFFDQLFDRFIQRFFDVVSVKSIKTLPASVTALFRPFRYLIVDSGFASDFTNSSFCCVCSVSAIPSDSVECSMCERVFHMKCVDPPMTRKPGKGFAWTCLVCSRGIGEHSDVKEPKLDFDVSGLPSSNNVESMWPYCYVGDFSRVREAIFEMAAGNAIMYPKAQSRIGPKYQAVLPALGSGGEESEEQDTPQDETTTGNEASDAEAEEAADEAVEELGDDSSQDDSPEEVTSGRGRGGINKRRAAAWKRRIIWAKRKQNIVDDGRTLERGNDDELQFRKPNNLSKSQVEDYIEECMENWKNPNKIDFLDRILLELHRAHYDIELAKQNVAKLTPADVDVGEWTIEEEKAFETAVIKHGHSMPDIVKEVQTKDRRDVVQYFYRWKKSRRYVPVYSQYCAKHRPGKKFKTGDAWVDPDEEDDEKIPVKKECANCWINKGPRQFIPTADGGQQTFCEECANHWYKYGQVRPISDSVRRANKEGRSVKKITKVEEEVPDHGPLIPCAVCGTTEDKPSSRFLDCQGCHLTVHEECYGEKFVQDWMCARCQNVKVPIHSCDYTCVLCGNYSRAAENTPVKRTLGGQWAHIVCSVWTPDTSFINPESMDLVQGFTGADKRRNKSTCVVCKWGGGVTIQCNGRACTKFFHVSCAQSAGWELVIEEGKNGKSVAQVYCEEHRNKPPIILDQPIPMSLSFGEDIAFYVQEYKKPPRTMGNLGGLQIKAKSWQFVDRCTCHQRGTTTVSHRRKYAGDDEEAEPRVTKRCLHCNVKSSPRWYPENNGFSCHKCWWNTYKKPLKDVEKEALVNDVDTNKELDQEMDDVVKETVQAMNDEMDVS